MLVRANGVDVVDMGIDPLKNPQEFREILVSNFPFLLKEFQHIIIFFNNIGVA